MQSAVMVHGPDWVREHLRVVHAICLAPEGPHKGQQFSHGWVEVDRKFVVQAGMINGEKDFFVVRRCEHYAELRVQVSTVYALDEVILKNRVSMHFGPWEPSYRALCNDGGDPVVFREDA